MILRNVAFLVWNGNVFDCKNVDGVCFVSYVCTSFCLWVCFYEKVMAVEWKSSKFLLELKENYINPSVIGLKNNIHVFFQQTINYVLRNLKERQSLVDYF